MPRPNGRDPETDPAAFLGDELRRGRLAAGYSSQESLAAELGFDRSVVTKAETGDRPPTPDVLAAWCKVCRLDYEHFARMSTLARRADGPVPRWFESWLDAEGRATMLRYWSPIIVPALFHTAEYARALLLAAQTDTSDDAILTNRLAWPFGGDQRVHEVRWLVDRKGRRPAQPLEFVTAVHRPRNPAVRGEPVGAFGPVRVVINPHHAVRVRPAATGGRCWSRPHGPSRPSPRSPRRLSRYPSCRYRRAPRPENLPPLRGDEI